MAVLAFNKAHGACHRLAPLLLFVGLTLPLCLVEKNVLADTITSHDSVNHTTNDAGRETTMEDLVQAVLNKDPGASSLAKKLGPVANSQLIHLAQDKDAKVRRIALYCLDETGGLEAARTFVEALLDRDSQIRGAALKGLTHHYQLASKERLLEVYDASDDAYVRQQTILFVGKIEPTVDPSEIKKRKEKESDPQALEGVIVVLARFKDEEARTEFVRLLEQSSGTDRLRYLEYCEYLHQPWLLKPMIELVRDTSPAIFVGVDAHPDKVQYIRVCDLVVELVASISNHPFSFPIVKKSSNYTVSQIDEVIYFGRGLP
jgi:HEAT repeat protein